MCDFKKITTGSFGGRSKAWFSHQGPKPSILEELWTVLKPGHMSIMCVLGQEQMDSCVLMTQVISDIWFGALCSLKKHIAA